MWYQRIREETQPDIEAYEYLKVRVREFYAVDLDLELAFQTRYGGGKNLNMYNATIAIYVPDNNLRIFQLMGTYNVGELERFKRDYANRSATNPTGSVEGTSNLLINGLFNNPSNPLYAWEIDSDTGGQATITHNTNRLVVASAVASSVVIRNNVTILNNLNTYKCTIGIFELISSVDVTMKIGSQAGATYSVKNVYNESIIASGTDFSMLFTFPGINGSASIDYVIIGQ